MRKKVKRLLKKYDYPPDGMEDALKIVIEQCEMWVDNEDYKIAAAKRMSSYFNAFAGMKPED